MGVIEAAPRYLSAMFFTEVVDRARPVIPRRPSPTVASNINGLLVQWPLLTKGGVGKKKNEVLVGGG